MVIVDLLKLCAALRECVKGCTVFTVVLETTAICVSVCVCVGRRVGVPEVHSLKSRFTVHQWSKSETFHRANETLIPKLQEGLLEVPKVPAERLHLLSQAITKLCPQRKSAFWLIFLNILEFHLGLSSKLWQASTLYSKAWSLWAAGLGWVLHDALPLLPKGFLDFCVLLTSTDSLDRDYQDCVGPYVFRSILERMMPCSCPQIQRTRKKSSKFQKFTSCWHVSVKH